MKKSWKRHIAALLAAVMVCTLLPLSALAGWTEETLTPETPAEEEAALAPEERETPEETPAETSEEASPSQEEKATLATVTGPTIPGYTLVTEMPSEGLSGKYLIVCPVTADSTTTYYVLFPGATGGASGNVRILTINSETNTATGWTDSSGTDDTTYSFDVAALTIEKNEDATTYSATAVATASGHPTYYLQNGGNVAYSTESPSTTTITCTDDGYFTFQNTNDNTAYLHYYSTGENFNQSGSNSNPANREMLLYKWNGSELPGFTRVIYPDQLSETKAYLIVSMDESGNPYALKPVSSASDSAGSGSLIGTSEAPKYVATLTVGEEAVTANVLGASGAAGDAIDDLSSLYYYLTAGTSSGYQINVLNNDAVFLGLNSNLFTSSGEDLTISARAQGGFKIYSSANRYLDFNKQGGADQFVNSSSGGTYGTDFWGPNSQRYPIYFYAADGVQISARISGDEQPPTGTTPVSDWKTLRPANGTSTDAPFVTGNPSTNYRIPALITLRHQTNDDKNGRLVAAIDARWDHKGDACSLDTMVSWSDDEGANWNYHFANYFGDTPDAKSNYGASFIDPELVESADGTIYMMVDVWPGGIALNTAPKQPDAATGYVEINGTKRLVLYTTNDVEKQEDDNWSYYVGDFDDGYATIYDKNDKATEYYVDEYYYLYHDTDGGDKDPSADKIYCQQTSNSDSSNDTLTDTWVQQNVFFYHAVLHVRAASYLWITKSVDGGETWSAPVMANTVRTDSAKFYGVGPGIGLSFIKSDGKEIILLPAYIWNGSNESQRASFIYSSDGGETWARSEDATSSNTYWSSESCLVQLDATTVRHFYRDSYSTLSYVDHTLQSDGTWTVGTSVDTGVQKRGSNGCQLSAIKYSEQIDGKDAIIVSTPRSTSDRLNGVLYVFLLNEDKTMSLAYTYEVTDASSHYGYSCISETANGDIANLYEGTDDVSTFAVIPMSTIAPNAVVGTTRSITVSLYDTYTFTASSTSAAVAIQNELAKSGIASCDVDGASVTLVGLAPGEKSFTYTEDGQTIDCVVQVTGTENTETVTLETGAEQTITGLAYGSAVLYNSAENVVTAAVSNQVVTPTTGQKGTDANFNGDIVSVSEAEFTFTGSGSTYTVSAGGYYLYPGTNNQHPLVTSSSTVTLAAVTTSGYTDAFTIKGSGYLYFHNDTLVWDKGTNYDTSGGYYFYIYQATTDGVSTEIPGYEKVTSLSDIVSSSSYLIVPAWTDSDGNTYVLYPADDSNNSFYSTLKVLFNDTASATLTLTGVAEGSAVVVINGARYDVTVNAASGGGDDTDVDEPGGDDTDVDEPGDDNTDVDEPGDDNTDVDEPGDDNTDVDEPGDDNTDVDEPGGDDTDVDEPGDDDTNNSSSSSASKPSSTGSSTVGTTTNKDTEGNTVTTEVDHTTGTVTTTTVTPEGAVTETVINADGSTVETVTQPDGSQRITSISAEKDISIVVKNEVGEIDAEVVIPAVLPENEVTFGDVAEDFWAKDAVEKVSGLGLLKGTGGNQFSGDMPTTRGMLVTILHRLSGQPWKMPIAFQDVPMDAYYAGAVDWAATVGVIQGVGANSCEPERNVTRQELVTMLYRYATFLGLDTSEETGAVADFADSRDVSDWAAQSMDWAVSQGLLNGRVEGGNALLAPNGSASRAEVAAILARFIDMIH